ncbi:hypothetical protein BDQ94DRAFT_133596 [Aspergillus welwitschiae]|uniref:Uncharacterized protein n=1 Tax=Aspergillus welwitschiae TaxID=1341132 RepID=A0A3F3QKU1_9EURO|nr:hypothetical protein BDQ94DRAFT_133596 [Aspergillus welwitschiae]RDH39745.1 hypothetical protein BDQ94DRAFT_133596 [Aspergillus welwitschiae]
MVCSNIQAQSCSIQGYGHGFLNQSVIRERVSGQITRTSRAFRGGRLFGGWTHGHYRHRQI